MFKEMPYKGALVVGQEIEAEYTPIEEPTQKHNVFIEALPKIRSFKEAATLIKCYPKYFESDRHKSVEFRLNAVERIRSVVEPLPAFLDVEARISRMIRSGYLCRNPLEKEYIKQLRAGFEYDSKTRKGTVLIGPSHSSSGFAILGISGSGKSHSLKRVLPLYPQVIVHRKYKDNLFMRKQLVWMYLDCPGNGSPRGLMTNFFFLFDKIMGTAYFTKECPRRTVDDLMPLLAQVSWLHGLGVLVIDEIQRLRSAKGTSHEEMLGFLVYLVNTVGVPIILIGTFKAIELLSQDFAEARRAAGQGDMIWGNLKNDEKDNQIWDLFISSIFRYQFTRKATPLNEALSNALYEESQGIIDIAVKLYMCVQWEVIGHGTEIITPELISKVGKKYFSLARPILEAIRNHDYEKLKKIDDIRPALENLDEYMKQAQEPIILRDSLATLRNIRKSEETGTGNTYHLISYVSKALIEAGYDAQVAIDCARKALDRFAKDTDLKRVMPEAFAMAGQSDVSEISKQKSIPGKSKKNSTLLSDDLRAVTQGQRDFKKNYRALKQAGKTKPANEFLMSPGKKT